MELEDIAYEKRNGIARIIINRPEVRNALRPRTYEEMAWAFRDAAEDPEIGVVVVTGAGKEAFSAGGDAKDQISRNSERGRRFALVLMDLSNAIRNMGKPVIAAVRGWCVGGGHQLHLHCDVTIASDTAKFAQFGVNVASAPVWGGSQMLPRIVGEKKAREIVFWSRVYDAYEAEKMGLVNKVVPDDQLEEEVERWCQEVLDKSPLSVRIAKLALNAGSDLLQSSYTLGAELLSLSYDTEEHREGVKSFLERRKPNFRQFRKRTIQE